MRALRLDPGWGNRARAAAANGSSSAEAVAASANQRAEQQPVTVGRGDGGASSSSEARPLQLLAGQSQRPPSSSSSPPPPNHLPASLTPGRSRRLRRADVSTQAAEHITGRPQASQARPASPAFNLASFAREPWSAYSRAYARPAGLYRLDSAGLRPPALQTGEHPIDLRSQEGQLVTDHRPTATHGQGATRGLQEVDTMPLGIWNTKDGKAPGTVTVTRDETKATAISGSLSPDNGLKYDLTGDVPILLVPQPTDDPNDPLNWPRWRRDLILVILSMMSVIASTLSPLLAANTFTLTADFFFKYTFNEMALLTGYHLLAVGLAGFLFVATARVWGKRHLYLLGTILIIASSAWGGATGLNYRSLLGARIVQGIGLAPFEALVNASVGDLFFVHERGARMALSNMALFGGAFFTPIIVGKMTSTVGWQWTFYLIAIFSGVMLPLIFFFVPETAYARPEGSLFDVDTLGNPIAAEEGAVATATGSLNGPINGTASDPLHAVHKSVEDTEKEVRDSSAEDGRQTAVGPPGMEKMSYWRTLLPFSGRKTDENVFKLVLRPIPLFLHPAVLWACLIQGALIGWTVLMGVVLAAIFITPPLRFSEVQTGYMYAGPFIGAVVGFVLSGLLADWSTKYLIRKNKGVYEPEFRIPLVILQLLFGCSGLYGFGWTSSQVRYGPPSGWFWPDFCFALEVAGMVVGAVASALYIVDAHRDIAVEAFTCLLIFKNIFSFGLTYRAFDWLAGGIWETFRAIGSVQVGICLLSVPMYIFGKRNRALFAKYDILKMLGLS